MNKLSKLVLAAVVSLSSVNAFADSVVARSACGDNLVQIFADASKELTRFQVNDVKTDFVAIRHIAKNGTAINEVVGFNNDGSGWILREANGMRSMTPAYFPDLAHYFNYKAGKVVICGVSR